MKILWNEGRLLIMHHRTMGLWNKAKDQVWIDLQRMRSRRSGPQGFFLLHVQPSLSGWQTSAVGSYKNWNGRFTYKNYLKGLNYEA